MYAARQLLDSGLTYDQTRQKLREGAADLEDLQPPPEPAREEPAEQPGQTAMISAREFQAIVGSLRQEWQTIIEEQRETGEEWRQLAEERRQEIERLRQELADLRRHQEPPESESGRPWWAFWR